jgi:hypothetical protein
MRAMLAVTHLWSMLAFAASGDAGVVVAQRSPVQLEVAEYRSMPKREPTADEIRTALVEVLKEQRIPLSSSAKTRLRVELVEAEKRDDEGGKACARVRSWIVEIDKEYLPKREMVTERCVVTSQPRISAAGNINWIGVADAISRVSHKSGALTDAYAEVLGEVIANLRRALDRRQ